MAVAARAALDPKMILERAAKAKVSYLEGTPSIAHRVSLAQVEAGLPPVGAGGVVEARRLVDPHAFPWFWDPTLALRAREDWPEEVPKASIMCDSEDFVPLVARLFQIGIVEPIDEADIFTVDGVKVLNGFFGVPNGKGETASGAPFLRFIMNFVPINSYLHELIGETKSLPNMAQWGHFVVHEDEIVLLYSEDQKASFYLYELNPAWRPYCVFRWEGSRLGSGASLSAVVLLRGPRRPHGVRWLGPNHAGYRGNLRDGARS